jgi:hypothetical protein
MVWRRTSFKDLGRAPHSRFAIRECGMDVLVLKPQDLYVALKIVAARDSEFVSAFRIRLCYHRLNLFVNCFSHV